MSKQTEKRDDPITGKFCPSCGYDMTGHQRAELVTCPECGAERLINDLLDSPPPTRLRREVRSAAKIVGFILFVTAVAAIGLLVSNLRAPSASQRGPSRPLSPMLKLKLIHQSAMIYGQEFGAMPDHMALLIADNYVNYELFLDDSLNARTLAVGDIDLANYNLSAQAISKLRETVEGLGIANTVYSFGDLQFVAWESVPHDSRLIFSWSKPDSKGARRVCFMDNTVHLISRDQWQHMWDQDAAARKELGLSALRKNVLNEAIE